MTVYKATVVRVDSLGGSRHLPRYTAPRSYWCLLRLGTIFIRDARLHWRAWARCVNGAISGSPRRVLIRIDQLWDCVNAATDGQERVILSAGGVSSSVSARLTRYTRFRVARQILPDVTLDRLCGRPKLHGSQSAPCVSLK